MIDRSTKIILTAIALGLWANVAAQITRPAIADSYMLTKINDSLTLIKLIGENTEGHVSNIALGWCSNKKLC